MLFTLLLMAFAIYFLVVALRAYRHQDAEKLMISVVMLIVMTLLLIFDVTDLALNVGHK